MMAQITHRVTKYNLNSKRLYLNEMYLGPANRTFF